jgi:maltodextrin utilization protein YvdJ
MTPEDSQRLETCLLEAAEILYRNTQTEELTSFESLEKAVRTKILEQISPKIAFFLLNKSQEQKKVEKE